MTHYTDSIGFYKNSPSFPAKTNNRTTIVEMELDFAKIVAERAAAGATALAAADTLDVLTLPEKTYVHAAGVDITNGGTTDLTLSLGIEGTPAHFLSAVAGDAEASFGSAADASIYFAAETALRLTFGAEAPGDLKVRVWAIATDTFGDLGDVPGTRRFVSNAP